MIKNENIEKVKLYVQSLKGESVDMIINKGRNKIIKINGIIDQVYPSMFVIKANKNDNLDRLSYSYNDILCGDIKFGN